MEPAVSKCWVRIAFLGRWFDNAVPQDRRSRSETSLSLLRTRSEANGSLLQTASAYYVINYQFGRGVQRTGTFAENMGGDVKTRSKGVDTGHAKCKPDPLGVTFEQPVHGNTGLLSISIRFMSKRRC